MDTFDIGLLVLRVWVGAVMLAHGVNHARSVDGTASWFESKGFKSARLQALLSAFGEIAIGLGLVLGLLTSFAAAGLIAVMLVAFWTIHRFAGFFVFHRPDEGWEYVATLAAAALALAIAGPGRASIDHALGIVGRLDGRVGAVIVAGGVVAAGLQLALFWRKPAPTS